MILDAFILFVIAFAAGAIAFYVPKISQDKYKLALVFAGSYLFSITIIHILPELYRQNDNPGLIGMLVLVGFFLQQGLEFFSTGVEHGHLHIKDAAHHHRESSALWVLIALGAHALLEGGLLAHPRTVEHHHNSKTLLLGILLHKAPEAFALMSVLLCNLKSRSKAVLYLILFACASPAGLYISDVLLERGIMSAHSFMFLFAVVSGNFLHISTTIVFESSVDHTFNAWKTSIAVLAAGLAVMAELFL